MQTEHLTRRRTVQMEEFVDEKGKGKMDIEFVDEKGKGKINIEFVDEKGKGKMDIEFVDEKGNGKMDIEFVDEKGKGKMDIEFVDEKGKGKMVESVDEKGKGKVAQMVDTKRKWRYEPMDETGEVPNMVEGSEKSFSSESEQGMAPPSLRSEGLMDRSAELVDRWIRSSARDEMSMEGMADEDLKDTDILDFWVKRQNSTRMERVRNEMIESEETNSTGMTAGESSESARQAGRTKMMGLTENEPYGELYRPRMESATVDEPASTEVARARQIGKMLAAAYTVRLRSSDPSEEVFKPFPKREEARIMEGVIIKTGIATQKAIMAGDAPRPSRLTGAEKQVIQERVDEVKKRLGPVSPYDTDELFNTPTTWNSSYELFPFIHTAPLEPGKSYASVETGGPSSSKGGEEKGSLASALQESRARSPGGLARATRAELAQDIAQSLGSTNVQMPTSTIDGVQQRQALPTIDTDGAPNAEDRVPRHQAREQSTRRGHSSRTLKRSDSTRPPRYAPIRVLRCQSPDRVRIGSARSRSPSRSRSRSR